MIVDDAVGVLFGRPRCQISFFIFFFDFRFLSTVGFSIECLLRSFFLFFFVAGSFRGFRLVPVFGVDYIVPGLLLIFFFKNCLLRFFFQF